MDSAISLFRRRVNFFSYFGVFIIGVMLWCMHNLLAQAFGLKIAGVIIYGASGICFLWSLFISLLSKEFLTSSFKPIASWYNNRQPKLTSAYNKTVSAQKSVGDASKAMGVTISETLVADENVVNAFQAGVGQRVVVFYRGLLQKLSAEGVRGVAFHEVGHAKNNDIFLTLVVVGFIQAFVFLSGIFWQIAKWTIYTTDDEGKKKIKLDRLSTGIAGSGAAAFYMKNLLTNDVLIFIFFAIVFWIVGNIIGQIILSLIGQNREFLADATAVKYGEGQNLITAFREMGTVEQNGTPQGNASIISHLCISPVPSAFLNLPSHPKLEKRIENIQKMMDGKEGDTAGGFLYFLLVILAGMAVGWLRTTTNIEMQTYFLGLPLFYLGLLVIFAKESYVAFGENSSTEKVQEKKNSDPVSLGGWILVGVIIALIFAAFGWTIYQTAIVLGDAGWNYMIFQVITLILGWTLYRKNKGLLKSSAMISCVFTAYIVYLILS